MNNSVFYSAGFKKGTVVWEVPIRFWEENYPIKCVVQEDIKEHDDQVYVYSEEYGHNVYMDRQNLFFVREQAIKVIQMYSVLKDLYAKDDIEYIMQKMEDGGLIPHYKYPDKFEENNNE